MPKLTDTAVVKATGRTWDEWFALLDEYGARQLDHTGIVQLLHEREGLSSGWWCQSVASTYERAIGRRTRGETADAGFQVAVTRTIDVPTSRAWDHLTGEALSDWLGVEGELPDAPGERVGLRDGGRLELRSIVPGTRMRVRLEPGNGTPPSTLQVYVVDVKGRTSLRFHHERLPDGAARERMRLHWKGVMARLAEQLTG